MLITLIVVTLIAMVLSGLLFVYGPLLLARREWLFTTPKENTGQVIVRENAFKGFVCGSAKFAIKQIHGEWQVVPESAEAQGAYLDFQREVMGVHWVGLPPFKIREDSFTWAEMRDTKEGESIKTEYVRRKEPTNFFFLKEVAYVVRCDDFETRDNLEVTIDIVIHVRIIFPWIALFKTKDWFLRLEAEIKALMNPFVKGKDFEDLVLINKEDPNDTVETIITDENGEEFNGNELGDGFIGRLGVKVVNANIVRVELTGGSKEVKDSLTAKARAERDGEAKILEKTKEGDAHLAYEERRAQAIEVVGKASAEATRLKMEQLHKYADVAELAIREEVARVAGVQGKAVYVLGDNKEIPKGQIALVDQIKQGQNALADQIEILVNQNKKN